MNGLRRFALLLLASACDGRPASPVPEAAPAPPASTQVDGAWSARVAHYIAEAQRQPQPITDGFALHGGDLHARLDPGGIELTNGWRFDYAGGLALPEVEGSRVIYRRGAGVTEWYEARPEGIEQGFTITELPPRGVDLIVRGRVETSEPGRVVDDGVAFGDLRYAGLEVFDAAGRPLRADIEWDAVSSTLALRVDAVELAGTELPIVIDPLLTTASWTADPTDQTGSKFGGSVASAGDVNGDGYADVVVGAYAWDSGTATDEGSAYLFLGSAAGLAATAAWTADPADQGGAQFGTSVAGAGDVNGDGYGDVLVGAHLWDGGFSNEGRAYLYLGGAGGLSATAAWTSDVCNLAGCSYGSSVAGAGDVNADGYADVAIGAYGYTGTGAGEGVAYLFLGGSGGPGAAAQWSDNPTDEASASFGASVASAGDVDGDGYGDVIVGAPFWGAGDEGRAYLYRGSAAGLMAAPSWTADPTDQAGARFGTAVAGIGDVDGDGFADVAVGAQFWDGTVANEGKVFVYLGDATGLAVTAAWTAEPTDQAAELGYSLAGAGDVNGDGFADLVVGAFRYIAEANQEGRAYLYLGSATGLGTTPAWTADPTNLALAYFGSSVAAAGDVNGDGFGDVIVGAVQWTGTGEEGRAYLFLGSATGLTAASVWTTESDQTNGYLGFSLASAGDVNGDGYGDVVVGAFGYDGGQADEGRAYLFLGSTTGLATTAAWTAESDQVDGQLGGSVASAGDVNGDGFGDVVVGAAAYDNGQAEEGRALLYLGSATGLSAAAAWTAESNQVQAYFGRSVASAGDVNGDGFGDVVVGSWQYSNGQTYEGRAFVYLGSATGLSASAAWTAESDQAFANFGYAVAPAGDVNGDGYGDVVVGSYYYDNGETDEGRAFLYLGSSTGLAATAAWTAESHQVSAYFGLAVASAGDVNGDGFGDVMVGAYSYDNGQADEGRAYLYLGSPTGLATAAAWTAESDQASAWLGVSVASAGDVNGDGYGDLVVGTLFYDNVQTDEGRAHLYLGSATGPATTAAWTAEPEQTNARFGVAVASAGDVNGDGFGDVVVGADGYDSGHLEEGRAFLYLGGDGAPGLARGLQQYRADGSTRIGVGTIPPGANVVLKGRVTQEGGAGGGLRLEVEVKPVGTPFNGVASGISLPHTEGEVASVGVSGLASGAYRWRARVVYPVGTGHGRWVSFGGNSEAEPDFRIQLTPNGGGCTSGGQCAAGICEDGICCVVTCGLCNSCNAAGTGCGVLPADDPACGTVDCDGLDLPCRDYADLAANRCDTLGMCDAANGPACTVFTDLSGPCSDGSACTSGDACAGGACAGAAIVCDDSNGCTDDSCNPASGCVFTNNTAGCDDASECTTGDACLGGACVGSTIVCDDTNECTTDSCDSASGCVFTNNGLGCDDGDDCTSGDVCSGGVCSGTGMCDAGAPDAMLDAGAVDAGADGGADAAAPDAAVANPDAGDGEDETSLLGCDCRVGASRRAPYGLPALLLLGAMMLLLVGRRRRS